MEKGASIHSVWMSLLTKEMFSTLGSSIKGHLQWVAFIGTIAILETITDLMTWLFDVSFHFAYPFSFDDI